MSLKDNKFVIIVEDDDASAEILGQYLELLGVKYRVIENGNNILAVLKNFSKIDVIFLDLDLPVHSGYEVLKAVRGDGTWDAVPIVVYTSDTDQKNHAREAGFHSFLSKPLKSIDFPQQLALILSNKRVWD